MKIAVITANMGNFDKQVDPVPQSLPFAFFRVTDHDFPLRDRAMTPRLQARIPKMFGWQMFPGYDIYIWVDSSCQLSHPDSVKWFWEQMGYEKDMAVFKHPNRKTVQEEADYIKQRLAKNCPYITPRYKNELIDEQLKEIDPSAQLYASTAFIYRNIPVVQKALKEWWYHTSRFHIVDQLSMPFALREIEKTEIPQSYLKIPYLKYVRK